MKLTLDHAQRLDLPTLLASQRADLGSPLGRFRLEWLTCQAVPRLCCVAACAKS